jgi:hypothetical protein
VPVEGELGVVFALDADVLAAAGTLELLEVVPDPPHPHIKSASVTGTATAIARIWCRVAGVSSMIRPLFRDRSLSPCRERSLRM